MSLPIAERSGSAPLGPIRFTGWTATATRLQIGGAQTYPADLSQYAVFSNGFVWKLPALWSNATYLQGTGVPNTLGQPACTWQ
jgi:hypothetical protein